MKSEEISKAAHELTMEYLKSGAYINSHTAIEVISQKYKDTFNKFKENLREVSECEFH